MDLIPVGPGVGKVGRAAAPDPPDAQVDDPSHIGQGGAVAHGRAVGAGLPADGAGPVQMGVKVDDVKGAGGLHPQDGGIGDRVVAAQDHRHGPLLRQQTHRLGQILKCGLQVPGDIVHVAAVHNGPAVGIQIHLVPLRVVGAAGLVGEPCGGGPDAPGPQPGPCAALDGQVKGSS